VKREVIWTVGGIGSLLAVVAILASSGTSKGPASAGDAAVSSPAQGNVPIAAELSAKRATTTPAVARGPVHWSAAPFSTPGDLFAAVFQPKAMTSSDAFSLLESLTGDTELREAAGRTEWIAAYGPSMTSELDIAGKLTLVIRETAPTSATDIAAARFSGRELSEYTFGEWTGVRVAAGTESILMERIDASGEYRTVESTVEHQAVVVIEHDPQTYVIVPEHRVEEVLRQQPSPSLAARLASLDGHAACGFVTTEGQTGIVAILARAGGDRTSALLQPAVELLKNATTISLTANLEGSDLLQATIGFADGSEAARVTGALGELKAQALAHLGSALSEEGSSPLLHAGRRLLDSLVTTADGATLRIRLPYPASLAALLTPESLSSNR
jgi:hypothetical protein